MCLLIMSFLFWGKFGDALSLSRVLVTYYVFLIISFLLLINIAIDDELGDVVRRASI